ncbi:putative epoxide hydrolase [Athelia psychrophila]|uniref:Epoxide hydrolase n=1 Tax=Athelia psychrophila TaxID=1759441 RepID=A0A166STB2_9AGAM|nr:putative epoxide hydrolase [Fibularhizoctonia sp. CBS 109695]
MSFTQLPANATLSPKPFKVDIPDATLDELRTLLKYHEAGINSFPNYVTTIEDGGTDFNIHFVALYSEKADAIPIVFLHGWPGSFLEFLAILAIMRERYTPATLPYHLIVPSVPGYAFSSPPPLDREFDTIDVARIFNKLMVGLGFGGGYVAQGGDIGSKIARILNVQYESCKVNITTALLPYTGLKPVAELSASEQRGVALASEFQNTGRAYAIEQGTRPATLGIVLSSSPVALLAWIGEKFLDWSDVDPPLDHILACATLYWVTECIATSFYPYRQKTAQHSDPEWRITKPLGYSYFPKELFPMPESWVATTGNLVFYKAHEKGGHFAAVEEAEALLEDVEAFIKQVWKP